MPSTTVTYGELRVSLTMTSGHNLKHKKKIRSMQIKYMTNLHLQGVPLQGAPRCNE